jgi:hypothetical protein
MDSEVRERSEGLGTSTNNPVNAQHGEGWVDGAVLREHGPQDLLGDNLRFVAIISPFAVQKVQKLNFRGGLNVGLTVL